jgi:hypothetical protein
MADITNHHDLLDHRNGRYQQNQIDTKMAEVRPRLDKPAARSAATPAAAPRRKSAACAPRDVPALQQRSAARQVDKDKVRRGLKEGLPEQKITAEPFSGSTSAIGGPTRLGRTATDIAE